MKRYVRPWAGALLAASAALAIAACGSSSSSSASSSSSSAAASSSASSSSAPAASGGTVTMLMGTAPQSLDPGLDYTTQGSEVNWLVYTGLTTYAHANGTAGTQLIPGLCTALPVISDGGKTYTCTLRKGLVFSNGQPVVASDFTYTVERAVKIPWGGSGSFITPVIAGAAQYAAGKAKTISGITTNDATGKITIHLTAPYGPFDNVLAFPSLGLIPAGFPMKVEPTSPPPGDGPYMVTNIVPNQSFSVVRNPRWAAQNIPGIPDGHVNINVKISPNIQANALAVLNNSADIFDWADTIPGSLLSQIQSQAANRFRMVNLGGSTYYIFLNVTEKPFSSQLAREAVVTGLNQDAMSRLGSGTLQPACFFLPPDVPGHPNAPCPYGTPGLGNLAKAKQLVKESGMEGQPVTVWSETRSPRQQWMTYYTQFLNSIGFHATQKVIADATYFTTIGESKALHPQTGFADWNQDFPNPVDFYGVLLDGHAILPQNNENFGQVNDPYINAQVAKLGQVPTTELSKVASQWAALDEYVARKAYVAVFGYQKFPEFTSDRINYGALVFQPIYGWDLSSFELK
ncbi:MAG TPA: ABC transporter substrate-binding protein [Solirubrobacteraceae bacterium]|nr:ABC transporter substrate-binding protein [Solirubrobacteraceae bacterium]